METYNNRYANRILEILRPIIGEMMSLGSLKSTCKQLGIAEDYIQQRNLPDLAEKIRKGLVIFLGTEGANKVANQIKSL